MRVVKIYDGQLRAQTRRYIVEIDNFEEAAARLRDCEQVLSIQVVPEQMYENIVGQIANVFHTLWRFAFLWIIFFDRRVFVSIAHFSFYIYILDPACNYAILDFFWNFRSMFSTFLHNVENSEKKIHTKKHLFIFGKINILFKLFFFVYIKKKKKTYVKFKIRGRTIQAHYRMHFSNFDNYIIQYTCMYEVICIKHIVKKWFIIYFQEERERKKKQKKFY